MNAKNGMALAVAAAALLIGAAACTDTTVQPKSTVTDANVFSDPSSYQQFIARVYAGLALSGQTGGAGSPDISGIDEGFSQYLRLYWEMEELPTDEAVIAWNDIGLPEMNTGLWNSQSTMVVAMYYRVLFQAQMANEFLRQTTPDKLAARGNVSTALAAQIDTFRAEARFLRALSYWHGADLFGGIPIVTEANAVGGPPPAQNTRAQVRDFVVNELNAIKTQLPGAGPSSYGRATQYAVDMLLANVYLNDSVYIGTTHWAEAKAAAADAIAGPFSLNANYHYNFLADNNTSPEIIFAITSDGVHTQTYGGTTFLVHASCGGSMNSATYGVDFCWWGLRLKQEALNFYGAGDGRSSYFYSAGQTDTVTSIPNFNNGVAAPKFQNVTSGGQSGSHPTFADTDFPMFRLAEAYLIYAEAAVRNGDDKTTSLGYVNALRERAYGNTTGDLADTSALTLNFILAERGRELLWEAHRRTDLVRYGLFTGGTYLWAWKGGQELGTATQSFRDLYPLPQNELAANPNLKQNPGY